jgi:hypothetical protein
MEYGNLSSFIEDKNVLTLITQAMVTCNVPDLNGAEYTVLDETDVAEKLIRVYNQNLDYGEVIQIGDTYSRIMSDSEIVDMESTKSK